MIDYSLIAKSIDFYENAGFKRIESPWTVTKQISDITKPADSKTFELKHDDNKVLVASAEQSFLYLYLKGFLPLGQYQSVTPCYRGDSFDNWHTKYFIKNELIKTDSTTQADLTRVMSAALDFFSMLFKFEDLRIQKTDTNKFDIIYMHNNGEEIELGSYGIRECNFLKWIYGTGCAEGRTSAVLKLANNQI